MSDLDTLPRSAEIPTRISTVVHQIGTRYGFRTVPVNDVAAAAAQEYFIAKNISDAADERKDKARDALMREIIMQIPRAKGKHVVHDSSVATVIAEQRAKPRKLSEEALINALSKELGNVDKAKQLIDGCKMADGGFITHLSVVLK
jgi:hypothetical protein